MDRKYFLNRSIGSIIGYTFFLTAAIMLSIGSCHRETEQSYPGINLPLVITAEDHIPDTALLDHPSILPAGLPVISPLPALSWTEFGNIKNSSVIPDTLVILGADTVFMETAPIITPLAQTHNSLLCGSPEIVKTKNPFIPEKNPYNFSFYGVLQGLRHNQIRALIQDHKGNLWLGTDDGLSRYDGRNFYHYTKEQGLNNNLILSIMEDSNHNIWFGSFRGGVTRFNGISLDIFTTNDGLPDNVVNHISEDNNGNIWFATGNGIAMFDGTSFTTYSTLNGLAGNDTRYILHDSNGYNWIATYGNGLSRFDGNSFINYDETNGLPEKYLTSLMEDRQGRIWVGTTNRGAVVMEDGYFLHYSEKHGLHDNTLRHIYEDHKGNIWFTASANGVSYFDGKSFTRFGRDEGLSADYTRVITEDSDGTIWIGTRGAGLGRYGGGQFLHYSNGEGLSSSRVMSINEDESGRIWFGTFGSYITIMSEGLSPANASFAQLTHFQGIEGSRIYSILPDSSGTMWLGSDGSGITRIKDNLSYNYTFNKGLAFNAVRDIEKDRYGRLWVATYGGGLSVFDGITFTNYGTKSGLSTVNLLNLHRDKSDNMWIGTDGEGLIKFSDGTFKYYSPKSGFPASIIYSIAEDSLGAMWFGTGGEGLVRFDGKQFTFFDTKQGLNNDYVMSLAFDLRNNLWIGTREGINILDAKQVALLTDSLFTPVFNSYGFEEGFTGISCNMGAIHTDSKGNVWIGASDRLTKASMDLSDKKPGKPTLQITDLRLNHAKVPWSMLFESKDTAVFLANGILLKNFRFSGITPWNGLPTGLKLSHRNNYITFDFSTITHQHNSRVRYQYYLGGLEKTWNTPTNRTEITYGNLAPGKYSFNIKAINNDGLWSNTEVFQFEVKPPWYNTTIFFISIIILVVLSVYLYILQREKFLRNEKHLLEKMVAEQTSELTAKNLELEHTNQEKDKFFSIIAHDLKGPFNGFLGLSQVMAEDIDSLSKPEIRTIAETMRDSASNLYTLLENLLQWSRMKNSTITFVPEELDLLDLVMESMNTLKISAEKKEISVIYDIHQNSRVRADKNMFLTILRNLISNAIKFTSAGGVVTISSNYDSNGTLTLNILDSGVGMSPEVLDNLFSMNTVSKRNGTAGEPSTGLGLILCKEFVELHGGQLWVESELGKGSSFYFSIPGKYN